MSESDSFISEVTEEVRRDRLFKTFKKYVWVLVLIVIAIVGGTVYNEVSKNNKEKQARVIGDQMQAAIAASDTGALKAIASEDTPAAVLANFQLSSVLAEADDIEGAVAALMNITGDTDLSRAYTDLAWLKIIMLNGANMATEEREDILDALVQETGAYRLLGIEQRALQHIRDGNTDAALDDLARILADETLSQGLRNRAQQLTISLGGTLETASNG